MRRSSSPGRRALRAGARPRAPGLPRRRVVCPRPLHRRPRAARHDRAWPDEALTYTPERLKACVTSAAGNALITTSTDPSWSRCGHRRRTCRARGGAGAAPDQAAADGREHGQLVRDRRADRELGRARLRRADVDRLRELVAFCMRLDEPDPVVAWTEHLARLRERAARLNESVRTRSLSRSRHGPDRRPASGCALDGGNR